MSEDLKLISVASGKGGVGKSTLAVNIAGSYKKHGKKVLVIDTDEQQTLVDLYHNSDVGFDVLATFPENVSDYDVVIVDHHPSHADMPLGDFVVCPLTPEAQDYASYMRWKHNLKNKKCIVVLNKYSKRDQHHTLLKKEISQDKKVYTVDERKVFKRASRARQTVYEMKGEASGQMRGQIDNLVRLIDEQYT